MMGKPAKILFASMLVAIISISITGYVYAETVTYQDVHTNQINEHSIIHSADFSSTVDTISISWETPVNEPKDYRVTWIEATEENYHSYKLVDGNNAYPTVSSYTITDLEEDTEYKIKIRPRYNDAPPGPWTDSVFISTGSTAAPDPAPEPEPTNTYTPLMQAVRDPIPEHLVNEMTGLHTEIDVLQLEIDPLQAKIDVLQAKIDVIRTEMQPLLSERYGLNNQINSIMSLTKLPSFITVNSTSYTAGDTVKVTVTFYEDLTQYIPIVNGTALQVKELVRLDIAGYDNDCQIEYIENDGFVEIVPSTGMFACTLNDNGTISNTFIVTEDMPSGEYRVEAEYWLIWLGLDYDELTDLGYDEYVDTSVTLNPAFTVN